METVQRSFWLRPEDAEKFLRIKLALAPSMNPIPDNSAILRGVLDYVMAHLDDPEFVQDLQRYVAKAVHPGRAGGRGRPPKSTPEGS